MKKLLAIVLVLVAAALFCVVPVRNGLIMLGRKLWDSSKPKLQATVAYLKARGLEAKAKAVYVAEEAKDAYLEGYHG